VPAEKMGGTVSAAVVRAKRRQCTNNQELNLPSEEKISYGGSLMTIRDKNQAFFAFKLYVQNMDATLSQEQAATINEAELSDCEAEAPTMCQRNHERCSYNARCDMLNTSVYLQKSMPSLGSAAIK